jgi:hypothetical protein
MARIPMSQPTDQKRRVVDIEMHDPLRRAEVVRGMSLAAEYSERAARMVQQHAKDDAERLMFLNQIGLDE